MPVNVIMTLDLSASVVGSRLLALQRAGDGARRCDGAGRCRRAPRLQPGGGAARAAHARSGAGAAGRLPGPTAEGDTALNRCRTGRDAARRSEGGRTLVVLFSDGVDTASFTRPEVVIETARRVNAVVYAVSTRADDTRFLRTLTEATGGRVLEVDAIGRPWTRLPGDPPGIPPPVRASPSSDGRRAWRLAPAERAREPAERPRPVPAWILSPPSAESLLIPDPVERHLFCLSVRVRTPTVQKAVGAESSL